MCIRTTITHIMENIIDIAIAPSGVNFLISQSALDFRPNPCPLKIP